MNDEEISNCRERNYWSFDKNRNQRSFTDLLTRVKVFIISNSARSSRMCQLLRSRDVIYTPLPPPPVLKSRLLLGVFKVNNKKWPDTDNHLSGSGYYLLLSLVCGNCGNCGYCGYCKECGVTGTMVTTRRYNDTIVGELTLGYWVSPAGLVINSGISVTDISQLVTVAVTSTLR